jgi:hypothetical protein
MTEAKYGVLNNDYAMDYSTWELSDLLRERGDIAMTYHTTENEAIKKQCLESDRRVIAAMELHRGE